MKRYALNLGNRLGFALRHPGYSLRSFARDLLRSDERFLAEVTGSTVATIAQFVEEPFEDVEFMAHLRGAEETFRELQLVSADLYAKKVLIPYAVVRASKPELIVETGVANGVSTAYVALALHRNGQGRLHSIEIGDSTYLPAAKEPGWFVPEWLRPRWTLHIGDSKAVLPRLLNELKQIDIFFHDSLHTYDHMMFEFEQAHSFLRTGGILLADDALWNQSLADFARRSGARQWAILRGVGVLRK